MEPDIKSLKTKRKELLEELLKAINSWDKTYEMGIKIIESIDLRLEEIKSINKSLEIQGLSLAYDDTYETQIVKVQKEYRFLLDRLQVEKDKLLELIKETRLKEKVKNNYILQNKDAIFIDKDL